LLLFANFFTFEKEDLTISCWFFCILRELSCIFGALLGRSCWFIGRRVSMVGGLVFLFHYQFSKIFRHQTNTTNYSLVNNKQHNAPYPKHSLNVQQPQLTYI